MNFTVLSGTYTLLMACEKGSTVVSLTRLVCYLLALKLNPPDHGITYVVFLEFTCVQVCVCGEGQTTAVDRRDIVISKCCLYKKNHNQSAPLLNKSPIKTGNEPSKAGQ